MRKSPHHFGAAPIGSEEGVRMPPEMAPDDDPLVRSEIMIRASQRRRIKAAGINLSEQVREWIDRDFPA